MAPHARSPRPKVSFAPLPLDDPRDASLDSGDFSFDSSDLDEVDGLRPRPHPPPDPVRRCLRWTRWLTLLLVLGAVAVAMTGHSRRTAHPSSAQPSTFASMAVSEGKERHLTAEEEHVVRMLTGKGEPVTPSTLAMLRPALLRMASTQLSIRPALHRALRQDTRATLLCPVESADSASESWLNRWLGRVGRASIDHCAAPRLRPRRGALRPGRDARSTAAGSALSARPVRCAAPDGL